jgi:hypothetical protein
MALVKGGSTNRATTNTVVAMSRSAASRQCPKCNRKSALKFLSDEYQSGSYCRWTPEGKCDYDNVKPRD